LFTKKGFTLLETLVVAGVIVFSLATWIFVYSSTTGTDQGLSADQEYYFTYSRLLARVKIDLRSALSWQKMNEKTYVIRILAATSHGAPAEKEVVYAIKGEGNIIERKDEKSSVLYDFSKYQGGKTFVFKLSP
jgi:type II secretory pathway pseudopilin PulG